MGIDIDRLGPAARAQVKAELARRDRQRRAAELQSEAAAKGPGGAAGSRLEDRYYWAVIWPKERAGLVAKVERHRRFELIPEGEYCGIRLPAAHYTPDFVVEYTNGQVEAVEVKHRVIRHLQRDYIYRRRLFIEIVARPRGWIFTEYIEKGAKEP